MSSQTMQLEDDDEDGVVAEYDVFITPELSEQIYLLQYPNRIRESPYNEHGGCKPVEMRIKPKSGFMELDLEIKTDLKFDKIKGVTWGEALRTAKESGTNAFGLASGFGKGVRTNEIVAQERVQIVARTGDDRIEKLVSNFDESNANGHVMNKQTLGGQIIQPEEGRPMYMLGAFRGEELHLSTVTGTVQMRPQFHHIDAQAQMAKAKHARDRALHDPPRSAEPRLVQQTARTAADDEELNIAKTSAFLTAASEEHWTRLQFQDEDSDEAYAIYGDTLFVKESFLAQHLKSPLNNDQYLDAISIPRIEPTSSKTKKKPPLTRKQIVDLAEESDGAEDAEEAPAPPEPLAPLPIPPKEIRRTSSNTSPSGARASRRKR